MLDHGCVVRCAPGGLIGHRVPAVLQRCSEVAPQLRLGVQTRIGLGKATVLLHSQHQRVGKDHDSAIDYGAMITKVRNWQPVTVAPRTLSPSQPM